MTLVAMAHIAMILLTSCAGSGEEPLFRDEIAPEVTITQPKNFEAIALPYTLQVDASDDVGIRQVQFFIRTTLIGTVKTAPYEVVLGQGQFPEGLYTFKATAEDTTGNKWSDDLTLQIKSPPADETPSSPNPSLSNLSRAITGTQLTLSLNASHPDGIATVEIVVSTNGKADFTRPSVPGPGPVQYSLVIDNVCTVMNPLAPGERYSMKITVVSGAGTRVSVNYGFQFAWPAECQTPPPPAILPLALASVSLVEPKAVVYAKQDDGTVEIADTDMQASPLSAPLQDYQYAALQLLSWPQPAAADTEIWLQIPVVPSDSQLLWLQDGQWQELMPEFYDGPARAAQSEAALQMHPANRAAIFSRFSTGTGLWHVRLSSGTVLPAPPSFMWQ